MPRFEGKGIKDSFKGIKVDDDREKKEGRDDRNLASDPCQYPKLDQSSGGKMDPEALCYGGGSMDVREHRRIHQALSMIILITVSPLR